MGAGGEQVFIDIIPRFASGAEAAIKDLFGKGINAAFTSREAGLIKEVFQDGIGTGLASAIDHAGTRNRLAAVYKSVSNRAGQTASAVGSALSTGASMAATVGTAAITGGTSLIAEGAMDTIKQVMGFITNAVQAANPAVMEQFSNAMSDVMAVVGQSLVPVMRLATEVVQIYGDYVASLLPDQKTMNQLVEAFQPALQAWKNILAILAPIIQRVAVVLATGLAWALEKVGQVVQWLIQTVAGLLLKVVDLISMLPFAEDVIKFTAGDNFRKNLEDMSKGGDLEFSRTARNAANRGASAVSVLELSRSDQLGAFGGGDPARETSKNTFNTAAIVLEIQKVLVGLLNNWNPRTS